VRDPERRDAIGQTGFSLVEVLFATTILAVALVSLAHLFVVATVNNDRARIATFATILAAQKMEQLRGLSWGFDSMGLSVTDTSANTAVPVETSAGGTGLTPSAQDSLVRSVEGYVDYVDRRGNVLGGGTTPLPGTAYIRRWSIRPLAANPLDAIALRVAVTPLNRGAVAATLSSMKTRKTP
jgi:prepilin-type N-terminal cleavage/methylation domain-containing protein